MSTWNRITITDPGPVVVDTLPDALDIFDEVDDERTTIPPFRRPGQDQTEPPEYLGRPGNPVGNLTLAGETKYHAAEAHEAIRELSALTGTITYYEEWDDDDMGYAEAVYRGGEFIQDEYRVSALVPAHLNRLVQSGLAALAGSPVPGEPPAVVAALRDLVDALDTTPAPDRRISVSGYPLPAPVVVNARLQLAGSGFILDRAAAERIAHTWRDAPADMDDIARAVRVLPDGQIITALNMDGEVTVDVWRPDEKDSTSYCTAGWPFDFTITPHTEPTEMQTLPG